MAATDQRKIRIAEQAWRDEARRRRDEIRSGKVKPISAEDVYRRIEKLLKK